MTRNITIATIFTLGTALLLGLIFLREKPRLNEAGAAISAERLERGARDYEQYCATCHGLGGQGGVQFGAPRLNNIHARYYTPGPDGKAAADQPNGIKEKYGTLRNYIEATLYSGVRGAPMPAFGAQGTLREDQIENITSYVLSWTGEGTSRDPGYEGMPQAVQARADLEATRSAPTPDPNVNPVAAGQLVFQNKTCVGCHAMSDQKLVGPGLGGLFSPEGTAAFGTTLPNNKPVNPENVREWIQGGSAAFPENIPDVTGDHYPGGMPGFALTDEEWQKLYTWLRVHNRQGELTEEGQQLQQLTGQQFAPEAGQPQPGQAQPGPGGGTVPTVVPTGPAQPNTAPNSQAQPTSEPQSTAETDATNEPQTGTGANP
jgi:mono/diheme cytochrome c family protein